MAMMASMAQPFTQHPGMPGHAMPHGGQPMVQGHPSNQGIPGGHQPGVSMGQQMHPGMAGPGGPQVSQAGPMMGGMMPGGGAPGVSGGGPNAHALSHLTPHQGQMNPQFAAQQQQQMQQAMAQGPGFLQQQQQQQAQRNQQIMQQRLMQQQQQQQAQQQHLQQQPNGGMMGNNGGPQMNQAQFMRGTPAMPVALPPHLQQQQAQIAQESHTRMQQEQARRQQQQQAAAQHQQQQQQLQHNQQNAQQQQQQAQQQAQQQQAAQQAQQQQAITQQQLAMQEAASQAVTTQGQPAPQSQTAAQNQAPPGQDPQAIEAQRQVQHQAQMQELARRQREQQNQAAQQQQAQQQQQQPRPDPGQQQPPNSQHSTPQQQQAQQQVQQQQIHQAQLQQQQQQQRQQAAVIQNQMQNQIPRDNGPFILRLVQFASELSQSMPSPRIQLKGRLDGQNPGQKPPRDMKHWQKFVDNFFSPKGMLRQVLWSSSDQSTKTFETPASGVARLYWSQFNSGVKNIQMFVEGAMERRIPNGGCFVESTRCTFVTWFSNGHNLVSIGQLRAQFDQNEKIDILDLVTTEHNEYVPRQSLVQAAAASPDIKQSPNQSKAAGKRAQQRQKLQQMQDQPPQIPVPETAIHEFGVTPPTFHFLEMGESISLMAPLFSYSHQNKHLSAKDALEQLCMQYQNQQQQMQQTPNPQQHPQFNPTMHHPNQPQPQNPQAQNFAAFQQNQMQNNNFLSPAQPPHLGLPHQQNSHSNSNPSASPATLTHSNQPTPSMQSMALQHSMGVPMAAQGSHQGTSAGATPVGGSPNVSGKKRRASGVGLGMADAVDGGVEINGVGPNKVKQSPRVGGKRQKGGG